VKQVTLEAALAAVESNMQGYVQGIAMTPTRLLEGLAYRARDLQGVRLYHMHLEGPTPHLDPTLTGHLNDVSWFIGKNTRAAISEGTASYLPLFLSDIPAFIETQVSLDFALIQVSPPDRHGYVSLGTSVEAALAAVKKASTVVALINPRVPRMHGMAQLSVDQITYGVWHEAPLYTLPVSSEEPELYRIAVQVAALVPDRATLQLGIGAIPDAVLAALADHHDLGIHSEMIADGVQPLIEQGVITGRFKTLDPGLVVCTFAMGRAPFYDFLDDNPAIAMRPVDYTNDTAVIRRQPRMVSVNSAVEVDLTGQVAAESIGLRMISGVGGQMDFVRGSSLSPGGFSIIALPSRTWTGQPRIVPQLHPGAAVTTTRNHVQWVVTEYGTANLHGLSLVERARALVHLAHPDDREALAAAYRQALSPWAPSLD
jgi:acyl-CoA hydrolase